MSDIIQFPESHKTSRDESVDPLSQEEKQSLYEDIGKLFEGLGVICPHCQCLHLAGILTKKLEVAGMSMDSI